MRAIIPMACITCRICAMEFWSTSWDSIVLCGSCLAIEIERNSK